jgi:hypothetical protein
MCLFLIKVHNMKIIADAVACILDMNNTCRRAVTFPRKRMSGIYCIGWLVGGSRFRVDVVPRSGRE